jgi:ATP adenylyltransferase
MRMDTLWAPWRMDYIQGPKQDGCFLCEILRAGGDDRANLVLKRGRACAVVMNRYPYNNGHLMVAPYRHVAALADLTPEERVEMMDLLAASVAALAAAMSPDGFNAGINLGRVAGAGLETHLHQHLVPRWNGDTNFMPVIAETKVIPQALDDLWTALRPRFA